MRGPVWFGDGRYLLWSDIPNNRILRWDEESNAIGVFRRPSGFANGNTRDRQGRLVTCEHGGRRIVRTEYDGALTVLADSFDGRRLNSPNDVVTARDGSVWFTDPTFGIAGFYEGERAESELPQNVYRLDAETGALEVVAHDIAGPNGLCFSPDESRLYLVEIPRGADPAHRRLRRGRRPVPARPPGPDRCRAGHAGRDPLRYRRQPLVRWGMGDHALDGVMVFNPEGRLIGRIRLPERCANLCFGGRHRNRLFMAASQSLYALYVDTQGCAGG